MAIHSSVKILTRLTARKVVFKRFAEVRAIAQYKQNHRAIMKWVIPAGGYCKCSIEANKTGKAFLDVLWFSRF